MNGQGLAIENIRLKDNGLIYAVMKDEDGTLMISATLDYILTEIRDRNLEVEGVTVTRKPDFMGKVETIVHLERIKP